MSGRKKRQRVRGGAIPAKLLRKGGPQNRGKRKPKWMIK